MAYFLGKDASANLDDLLLGAGENKAQCLERCKEQLALDPGFDYNGCVDGCGSMAIRPGETQGKILEEPIVGTSDIPALPPFSPEIGPGPGEVAPEVPPEVAPGVPTPPPETNWLDDLIAGRFCR